MANLFALGNPRKADLNRFRSNKLKNILISNQKIQISILTYFVHRHRPGHLDLKLFTRLHDHSCICAQLTCTSFQNRRQK
ncbi:hypothetical protein BpHYR1_030320 [Brachionus plicatilis]|uniref:Uncharacterized protein n=1 Tax=Brachionus plicatilis TaxID=10195 RepID=A0A3M7RR68_BRAPC|nr:hypothetical protein BpHYR1_030320 [Brachionus plicatilis]